MKKLFSSNPYLDDEMINEAKRSLKEEFFVGGKSVDLFEKEFAEYINVDYAVAVSSGTDALIISQKCLNIDKKVITTPVTFVATVESIVLADAIPKFIDIDKNTWNLNINDISKEIDEDVKAIMPVHLYGNPCNMDQIKKISNEYNLKIIEDCAQAHGAEFNNKKVGYFGDINAFSFYSTKNMTVGGNGGMITTNDKKLYEKAKLLREHGGSNFAKYVGYNSRMNTVNAAIGRCQLKHLDEWNEKRKKLAKIYYNELKNVNEIKLPYNNKDSVYHLFVIEAEKRDQLQEFLKTNNIFCGIHYPLPINLLEPYKKYSNKNFKNSEIHTKRNISLPLYPDLKNDDVVYVCNKIKKFYEERKK